MRSGSERLVAEVGFVGLVSMRAFGLVSCRFVEEADLVRDDIETAPVLAGRLVAPGVLAEPCRHADEATFGEVAAAGFGERSERDDVDVVRSVSAATVDGNREPTDWRSRRRRSRG